MAKLKYKSSYLKVRDSLKHVTEAWDIDWSLDNSPNGFLHLIATSKYGTPVYVTKSIDTVDGIMAGKFLPLMIYINKPVEEVEELFRTDKAKIVKIICEFIIGLEASKFCTFEKVFDQHLKNDVVSKAFYYRIQLRRACMLNDTHGYIKKQKENKVKIQKELQDSHESWETFTRE